MKKRLLSVLSAVVLIVAMMVPMATPVLAADPPVLTDIGPDYNASLPYFITSLGINRTYTGLTFTGTDLTGATLLTFSGTGVTASITNNTGTVITADVTVAAGAAHGPRSVTVTTPEGTSDPLYNNFFVAEFPTPPDTNASDTYVDLAPYFDAAGGSNITVPGTTMITVPVAEGTTVWYKMTLKRVNVAYSNTMGGQLSLKLPGETDFIPVAGYGATTSDMPEIGEIVVGGDIVLYSPVAYTAEKTDLNPSHVLYAEVAWGHAGTNTTQLEGFIEGSSPSVAHSGQTITLDMLGSLKVTKDVVIPAGVYLNGLDKTFSVLVEGPSSFSQTLDFVIEDGVITSPDDGYYILDNLTPGNYYISETPGSGWVPVIATSPTSVTSGQQSEATVTNTLVPGSLKLTKALSIPAGVIKSGIDGTFTVRVTASNGYDDNFTFSMDDGVIDPEYYIIDNLTPGVTYHISENDPGSPWTVSYSTQDVTIESSETPSEVTVTNTYIPGSLRVYKVLTIPGGVDNSTLDDTFTVHVTGDNGFSLYLDFEMENGKIIDPASGYYQIDDLTPGVEYSVDEDVDLPWSVSYTGNGVVIVSGETEEITVTNTYHPGKLEITKVMDYDGIGANYENVTQTFTVYVDGISGHFEHDFEVTDGVLSGSPWLLEDLIPGDYDITEKEEEGWQGEIEFSPTTVESSETAATVKITNFYIPGSLEITKRVHWGDLVNYETVDDTFTVTVTGPSGTFTHDFVITNGHLDNDTWLLENLVPGDYQISEGDLETWDEVVTASPTHVTTGLKSFVIVDNTYIPGSLKVVKVIDWNGNTPLSMTFSITIEGPSYPSGDTRILNAEGELIWEDLIPGDYEISEEDLGVQWEVPVIESTTTEVPAGGQGTATVTNEMKTGELIIEKRDIVTGELVTKEGVAFSIEPNPYDLTPTILIVEDNGDYDTESAIGVIHLVNLPLWSYEVIEVVAPPGYAIDPEPMHPNLSDPNLYDPDDTYTVVSRDEPLYSLIIYKFNDRNGNGIHDLGEGWIAGWKFIVSSPNGYNAECFTDVNGKIELTDLKKGEYTVYEVERANWELTTLPNVRTQKIGPSPDKPEAEFIYGNKPIPVPGVSIPGLGLLVAGLAGAMIFLARRRSRKTQLR